MILVLILSYISYVSPFLFGGPCSCPTTPQCPCVASYTQPQPQYQSVVYTNPSAVAPPPPQPMQYPPPQDTSYGGGYVAVKPPATVTKNEQSLEPYEVSLKKSVEVDSSSDPKKEESYKVYAVRSAEDKCTSNQLRTIIQENIDPESLPQSKKQISAAAKKQFGYNFDVICSNAKFSYLIMSALYCEHKKAGVICIAFQH